MVTAETALLIREQLGSLCFANLLACKMRIYFCALQHPPKNMQLSFTLRAIRLGTS